VTDERWFALGGDAKRNESRSSHSFALERSNQEVCFWENTRRSQLSWQPANGREDGERKPHRQRQRFHSATVEEKEKPSAKRKKDLGFVQCS
jgi:hypothetical protein